MRARREVWLVEWFDAHDFAYEWTDVKDVKGDPKNVQSVGFLVEPSPVPGYVTLVTSDDGDGFVANGINIPLVNIVNRVRLDKKVRT